MTATDSPQQAGLLGGRARSGRLVGVDIARCLALVGMMATHILPSEIGGTQGGAGGSPGEVAMAHQIAAGRASALFAVLAGLSLVLVAGTRQPLRGRALVGMTAGTVARSGVIGLIGLLLGGLDSGIAVILVYYAALFVVAVPLLALRTHWLAVLGVAWMLAGPVLSHLWRQHLPISTYAVPSPDSFEQPLTTLRELMVTGYYPVVTWVPFVLLGMVVGRLDLRSTRTAGLLAGVGLMAVVVAWQVSDALIASQAVRAELVRTFEGAGWRGSLEATLGHGIYGVTPTGSPWWLAVRAPHSGTPFDLLMTSGSALAVLGCCLLLGRLLPRVLSVVFGAGAMTLTLYTLHVFLRTDGAWDGFDTATFVGQVVLVLLIGAAYRVARQRGPLEVLAAEAARGARRAVAGGD